MRKLTKDSVLLFTGGGKGITAQCAIELSTVLPCTYVLMGRSRQMILPDWLSNDATEQKIKHHIVANAKQQGKKLSPKEIEQQYRKLTGSREIENTIRKIQNNGAAVHYIAADVTDPASVQRSLQDITENVGAITGFVHGAGRLADKRIERKTEDDFYAVYGTKVAGLKAVMSCINPNNLELLVVFSSVSGAFGNAGQTDYAMANEYLTKFAFQFKDQHPECHTISINWGPWDSGMVNPTLKEAFSQMGISLISIEEGTQQFVREVMEFSHSNPQVVFGSKIERPIKVVLPTAPIHVKREITPKKNPFLLDHQIGPNRVLPATCAAEWIADTCEKLFPSYHFSELRNYQVLKGLVFADDTPHTFDVCVTVEESISTDRMLLNVVITSLLNDKEVIHYRAQVLLRQNVPAPEIHKELAQKANWPVLQDGEYFYDEKVLFHGPAFRGLKSVLHVTKDELTTICHLPAVSAKVQGQFPSRATNPYANDVVLQGILAWSFHNYEKVCLPAGIELLTQYQKLPFDQDIFVDVTIVSQSRMRAKADAVIFDQQGRVFMFAKGIEGTMSKALRGLFKESATSLDRQPSKLARQG